MRAAVQKSLFLGLGRYSVVGVLCLLSTSSALAQQTPPPFVQRGLPSSFHAALRPLEGRWRATKQIFIAIGTAEHPAISEDITTTRSWIAGGRHLLDVTQGSIGGTSYYRMGVIGFSNIDHRYEFATFDGMNANSMLYRSEPLDRPASVLVLSGTFTDQGLLGEAFAGKTIPMRTIIRIDRPDQHEIELRFDVPGGQQDLLIDRTTYTRITE
jgi:hypothetical protein